MKVLIVSTNSLPASPAGAAYIAGAAQNAHHEVEVFECLFAADVSAELSAVITRFSPDVVAVSIRLVHGYLIDDTAEFNTIHVDLRPRVRQVVDVIKNVSSAHIVVGGPGFNYFAQNWLEYLDLDYGIRGEADFSFPQYLRNLERGEIYPEVPGSIIRNNGRFYKTARDHPSNLDKIAFPAYELFDLERYHQNRISPAILTKRGCAFRCSYCPYSSLEGNTYRLKSPARVIDEMEHIRSKKAPAMFMFCDNNFNIPYAHARGICQEIIHRGLDIKWGTGDLRPMGITDSFCNLLRDSGCGYVNLSIESGSDKMLKNMKRGYSARQVLQALETIDRSGIPYGASLMIGAPGETPETVVESLQIMNQYPVPLGKWVTIGICLWSHRQEVLAEAYKSGQIQSDAELFEGVNYMSPELPKEYMVELIESLHKKSGYMVQVNKPYAQYANRS